MSLQQEMKNMLVERGKYVGAIEKFGGEYAGSIGPAMMLESGMLDEKQFEHTKKVVLRACDKGQKLSNDVYKAIREWAAQVEQCAKSLEEQRQRIKDQRKGFENAIADIDKHNARVKKHNDTCDDNSKLRPLQAKRSVRDFIALEAALLAPKIEIDNERELAAAELEKVDGMTRELRDIKSKVGRMKFEDKKSGDKKATKSAKSRTRAHPFR